LAACRLVTPGLAVMLAVAGCTGSSDRGPGEVAKPVPPTAAAKPAPLETVKPSPEVAREGSKLPPPRAMRNWDEVRRQAAERMVAANPDITYTGKVPDQLLSISVLEVELNADGSVRRIEVLRPPRFAKETCRPPPMRCAARPLTATCRGCRSPGSSSRPSSSTITQVQAADPGQLRSSTGLTIPAMFFNLPTLLTWARIVAIPLVVGVYYISLPEETQNVVGTALFILFALTDWADGYLARKLDMTSSFGAFLDPVADKFLVTAALLVLVHLQRLHALVALVIIGREIAISALREWMAQIGASRSVAVHMLAS
jgi:phosphatidylglycerophosphate synthase